MRLFIILASVACVQACSSNTQRVELVPRVAESRPVQQNTIHQYSIRLANAMNGPIGRIAPTSKVAVGTFLPPQSLQASDLSAQESHIALQLQESFMTLFSQMGYSVVEYRTRNTIELSANADVMLSRDLDDLTNRHGIDYFVTGTITAQQDAYVVNVRMIKASNHHVVGAATDYLPNNVLTSADKVNMDDGYLQRRAY